jgi:hypothetical protein
MRGDVTSRLVRKLGLKQSPGEDTMKDFANRARTLQAAGRTVEQAAIMAAKEKFAAEFEPTRYDNQGESMEVLLADIEKQ